jgi:hypothetical protein
MLQIGQRVGLSSLSSVSPRLISRVAKRKELSPRTGILTAIMAFAVIKVETLLFGLKFGYCGSDVLRTRARCDGEWFAWNQKGERRAFGIYVSIAVSVSIMVGR